MFCFWISHETCLTATASFVFVIYNLIFFSVEKSEAASKKKSKSTLNTSINSSQPNTYTLLQNLNNSKMSDFKKREKPMKIISSSKNTCKVTDISKSYTSFIEINLLNNNQENDLNVSNKLSCFKINEEQETAIEEKEPNEKEESVAAKQIFRRRSERLSSRRSSVDFQVAQKFRKQKPHTETSKESPCEIVEKHQTAQKADVPEEFSLTGEQPLDLNVSFVHDEEEGLVCTSQTTGTTFKVEDCVISPNVGTVNGCVEDDELVEDVERATRDVDSGISDSEETNVDEEPVVHQPHRPRKPPVTIKKNRSFTQHKPKKQDTSAKANQSTFSNQSLNKSTSFRKVRLFELVIDLCIKTIF